MATSSQIEQPATELLARRRTMARRLKDGIFLVVAVVVSVLATTSNSGTLIYAAPSAAPEQSRTERLLDLHDCWTGDAPADMVGRLPGHVVTDRGYGGARMVEKSLEQVFNGADHGIRVYGFCR